MQRVICTYLYECIEKAPLRIYFSISIFSSLQNLYEKGVFSFNYCFNNLKLLIILLKILNYYT